MNPSSSPMNKFGDDEAKISTEKMITKSKGKGELPNTKAQGISNAPTGSGLWSGLKDPRIVRASRGLGGKDRHSKVSTIRGLRDRRVRLSVSTAIQLYDLQDRLGLNQPSKAVDWLLNAAQHEIDKLPPLQLPLRDFDFRHHDQASRSPAAAGAAASNKHLCLNDEGLASSSSNTKVINTEDETLMGNHDVAIYNAPHHHHPPRGMPFASYYHWDPSNRSFLSQFGILSSPPSSHDHSLTTNTTPAPPSQLLRCPPPMFSSYMTATLQNEFDGRQFMSHLQMGSAPQKPDHFN